MKALVRRAQLRPNQSTLLRVIVEREKGGRGGPLGASSETLPAHPLAGVHNRGAPYSSRRGPRGLFTKKTVGSHSVLGLGTIHVQKRRKETGALLRGSWRPRVKVDFRGLHTGNEDDHRHAKPHNGLKAIAIGERIRLLLHLSREHDERACLRFTRSG